MKLYVLPTLASCLALASSAAGNKSCGEPSPPTTTPVATAPLTPEVTTAAPYPPATATESPGPEIEAPVTDAPVTESPVTEVPVTEAPVTEVPVTEAPVTEAPVTEAPVTESPATKSPGAETDEPVTEAPVTDAPGTKTPGSGGSTGSDSFARFFNASTFAATFPGTVALYDFQGLIDAATDRYPGFANTGDDESDKRELAAFLAQTAHESGRFQAAQEINWESYPESKYCDTSMGVACISGHRYHGRGPIQISWNYNYNAAGQALGLNLLNAPELVATDSAIAWSTGLWFWMTPQKDGLIIHDVVTLPDGFAKATDVINGALECGGPASANEQQRITYYEQMCALLGVEPLGKTSCNA